GGRTDTPLPAPTVAASSELAAHAPEPPQLPQPLINVVETPSLADAAERPGGDGAGTQPTSDDAATAAQPAAEEFIEIWRPGRRDGHARKPRRERRPRQRRPQREAQPPSAAADPPGPRPGGRGGRPGACGGR